jgi:SNF2 family DNA or RNA helicase
LADEMGLGKTVMMIALIHSDLNILRGVPTEKKRGRNLIVVPVVLMD